jgi:Fuc2NAc and GlcNAc transferase
MFESIYLLCAFAVLSGFSVWLFRVYALKKNLLDRPNQRSSHSTPTPRGGGIVFPILWLLYLAALYFLGRVNLQYLLIFAPAVLLISLVSFLDDRYSLPAALRFSIQLLAAILSLAFIGGFPVIQIGTWFLHWGIFGAIFAVLALVWSTNLYNFMDGIDGIAAIEALFVFGVGGYFIWQAGGHAFANLIWVMAAIIVGFFFWNRPPAKIFMGDVGSALLGFLVILFGLIGEINYKVPLLLWVILYGVFWFDATVTLVRRILHGEKWYQAHRLHAYQRLQLMQWSHAKILKLILAINCTLSVLAIVSYYYPQYALVSFLGSFIIVFIYYLVVEKKQPMYPR